MSAPPPILLPRPFFDLTPSRITAGRRSHSRADPMLENGGHHHHYMAPPCLRTGRPRLDNTDRRHPVGSPHGPDTILTVFIGPGLGHRTLRRTRFLAHDCRI